MFGLQLGASCNLSTFYVHLSIFVQVGIIMYLPTTDPRQRKEITEEFFHYRHMTQTQLWDQYSAYEHWAKIEVPILCDILILRNLKFSAIFGTRLEEQTGSCFGSPRKPISTLRIP